jgi:23S rRNA pseudouridine1911/1915/1917 synthase
MCCLAGLVHRIDKNKWVNGTCQNRRAVTSLAKQFFDHCEAPLHGSCLGDFNEDAGTVRAHVGRYRRFRKLFDAYPEGEYGKEAITHYKVLERFGYVTLIQCELETGRTHQIRVHMKYLGHPLFSDELYGGDKIIKGTVFSKYKQFVENCFAICPRHALHAKTIGFIHPATQKEVFFESKIPADMEELIEKWRNYVQTRGTKA